MNTLTILAAEESNGFWLPGDKLEIVWGSIAFFIVMGLLYKFAYPAIIEAMAKRTQGIADTMGSAEKERVDAEAERDEIKSALADSDTEAARIVAEARDTADQLLAEAVTRADADAAAIRERIPAEVDSVARSAQSDLSSEVARLSLAATEQVVGEQLDSDTHQALIEGYIAQIGTRN